MDGLHVLQVSDQSGRASLPHQVRLRALADKTRDALRVFKRNQVSTNQEGSIVGFADFLVRSAQNGTEGAILETFEEFSKF